ncbi:MAG TPA: ParB/RepB/Spo0J family partition protein [Acidobacteriota bacterium]|nr:ParB/RepB/Spo0J family partition protein [Acidobacteriota bacterium]
MKRKALGRGLDALLPSSTSSSSLLQLDIELIRPNPLQPRIVFDPEKLEELATSLKSKGILQPIVVRPAEGGYQIIAGERRWRASQRAGIQSIPAIIHDVSDREMVELALVENLQRDDLNPIEEAQAYQMMNSQFGLTQEQIADRVGRSRVAVANTLRLLQLPQLIQSMVVNDQLSMGHARALLPLPESEQLRQARAIVDKGLSVRQTEARVRKLLTRPKSEKPARDSRDPNLKDAERRLEQRFQTKIEIRTRGDSGQILLHYHSQEELDRLFEELLGG